MALEQRALQTVAPVDILAQRLDMTLTHDRSTDLARIACPSLIVGTRDDATVPCLSVGGPAPGHRRLAPRHPGRRRPLLLPPPLAGVEQDRRCVPEGYGRQRVAEREIAAECRAVDGHRDGLWSDASGRAIVGCTRKEGCPGASPVPQEFNVVIERDADGMLVASVPVAAGVLHAGPFARGADGPHSGSHRVCTSRTEASRRRTWSLSRSSA